MARRKADLWSLLLLGLATSTLFWTLFAHVTGYLSWGNYLTPFTTSQIRPSTFLYNPDFQNGVLTFFPSTALLYELFEGFPLLVLSSVLGLRGAIETYALLTTVFVAISFYFLTRALGARPIACLVAALFFTLNDFQIWLIASGVFVQFVAEGFLLLGLGLLALWIRRGGRRLWVIVASFGCLALSAEQIQLALLGGALFLALGVVLTLHHHGYRLRKAGRPLARFLVLSLALAPIFAYAILPLLAGSYSYTSSSLTAITTQSFAMRSEPVWELILLIPPTPFSTQASALYHAYPLLFAVWGSAMALLLGTLLVSLLVVRDLRLLWISVLILLAATLGASSAGPLGGVSTYLYLHFPGYASINSPYFWEWVPISILYGVALSIVVEVAVAQLSSRPRSEPAPPASTTWTKRFSQPYFGLPPRRVVVIGAISLGLLVVLAVLPPVASDAAYGSYGTSGAGIQGIHGTPLPADYANLDSVVSATIGNSGTGVAYFPGDVFDFLPNSTTEFNNPFTQWTVQREPGLPFYGAPAINSNYYFYWVYHLFYTNQTHDLGALLGVEGISVFVVLYGLNSASYAPYFMQWAKNVNASALMPLQSGVHEIYTSKNFAVWKSNYLAPEAAYFSGRTLVAGSVSTIDAMAYSGWNLTTEALSVTGDGPPPGSTDLLAGINSVVLGNQQALYDLAFREAGAYCVGPTSLVDTSLSATDAWTSSQRAFSSTGGFDDPLPFAFASGAASVTISIPNNGPPGALLWVELLRTAGTGTVQFAFNGQQSLLINTVHVPRPAYGVDFDGFSWNNISFNSPPLSAGGQLTVRSVSGLNGIAEICVASPAQLAGGEASLLSEASHTGIGVSMVEGASSIANTWENVTRKVGNNYTNVPTGRYVVLNPGRLGASIEVQVPSNAQSGTVYVLVGNASAGQLSVVTGSRDTTLLNLSASSDTNVSTAGWQWYPVPLSSASGWSSVNVTAVANVSATVYVAAVAYVPNQQLTPAGLAEVNRAVAQRLSAGRSGSTSPSQGGSDGLQTIPIVNGSVLPQGVPIQPTVSGFQMDGGSCLAGSVLVRTSYFSTFRPGGSATSVYPTFAAMNLVVVKGAGCAAEVSSSTWTYILAGGAISLGTLALLAMIPVYPVALRATRSAARRLRPQAPSEQTPPVEAVTRVAGTTAGGEMTRDLLERLTLLAQGIGAVARLLPPGDPRRSQAAVGLQEVNQLLSAGRVREAEARLRAIVRLLAAPD